MRLNSLLLSMSSIVLLCTPNFTLAQESETDPFKDIQKNENPFGIETQADDTPVQDPFADPFADPVSYTHLTLPTICSV